MNATIKLIIIFLLSINLFSAENLQKVSVQLDWKFQFQHAGFIMAKEKGFYKEAGLNVTLLEYKDGMNIGNEVLGKKVDFGISNNSLMFENKLLKPLVLLATYLQRSPLVFVTQPDIKSPLQLNGKKIMATNHEYKNSTLTLLMEHFFIKGVYIPHTYSIKEFKEKKIDAMSAFISNELYELDKEHIPYNIIDPYQYGFITNAINLFCSYEVANEKKRAYKKIFKCN